MYSPLQAASWGFLLLIANLSLCEDSLLHTLSGSFPELIGAATGGFYLSFLLLIPVSWLIYNKICPFDGYGDAYPLILALERLRRESWKFEVNLGHTERSWLKESGQKAKTNNDTSSSLFSDTGEVLSLAAMPCRLRSPSSRLRKAWAPFF